MELLEGLEIRQLLSAAAGLPYYRVALNAAGLPMATTSPSGFSPAEVRKAYGLDQVKFGGITGDGTGQIIAIVDAYDQPYMQQDLHTFSVQYGLPDATLLKINQSGSGPLPAADPAHVWGTETSLDVEWVHAMAPGATIVLVETNSNSWADLLAGVDRARNYPGVSAISMSWGHDEQASDATQNGSFVTPTGHAPITFIAATGDAGAFAGIQASGSTLKTVSYPSASPNVLAVGGTTLRTDFNNNYLSESAWGFGADSTLYGGAGGGVSRIQTKPTYQQNVSFSALKRTTPDVAFLADPATGVAVIDSYDNPLSPWTVVGGTSLAAPMWAGLMGVVNQGRAIAGLTSLNGSTQTLPTLYQLPAADFHDVVSGSNGYAAGPGYDLVTGLGTPVANLLVPALAGSSSSGVGPLPTIGGLSVTAGAVVSGAKLKLTATGVTEVGGRVTRVRFYREKNGTAGLQSNGDELIGEGVANRTSWILSTRAGTDTSSFAPGDYTYYAVAYDAKGNSSMYQVGTLTVVAPTIGQVTVVPSTTKAGSVVTLKATNVTEPSGGVIRVVKFYLETNTTSGLQIGADRFLGSGTLSAAGWSYSFNTTGLTTGTYAIYAVATDIGGISSPVVSTILNVM